MSGTLTGKNRAFLADTYLSGHVLAALDSGEGVVFYGETINRMLDEARAPDPAVAVLEAEVARLRGALQSALTFIEDLAGNDLDETAADGGVTVGMVMQQQASTVFGPRLLAALNPAPSEKEAG